MDIEDRLTALEQKQADLDRVLSKLVAFARLSPAGRIILKTLGLR
jgi:hypothetical protein